MCLLSRIWAWVAYADLVLWSKLSDRYITGEVPFGLICVSEAASTTPAFKNVDSKEGLWENGEEKEVTLLQIVCAAVDYLLGQWAACLGH